MKAARKDQVGGSHTKESRCTGCGRRAHHPVWSRADACVFCDAALEWIPATDVTSTVAAVHAREATRAGEGAAEAVRAGSPGLAYAQARLAARHAAYLLSN